uniref:hypothetical protein n=1 Tax=Staphylococcus epidermidis TaxID=1282 RepID=UPI001C92ECD2
QAINQIAGKTNSAEAGQHSSPYQIQNHPTNNITPINQLPSPPFPLTTDYFQHPKQIHLIIIYFLLINTY